MIWAPCICHAWSRWRCLERGTRRPSRRALTPSASIPALRALELGRCVCGDGDCEIVGCAAPETVEVLAELRAAWPGLELRRFEKHDRTQA
jgi:hypothetical protein